ncbi:hypothetical protein E2562_028788 [Oryza meyeriana var. granulata]|uniref:Ubiquitin-like protease family profile domain-containing protein n=1 Tax=Oryza meyeriana var. granulata TaxID=110450 RepID=A0A6G1EAQ4_9ORYZ|nr:hypothetical protein E2562_028788 [Oryza meyeriana var. granulata]
MFGSCSTERGQAARMHIILPVLNNDHWSLYIINFLHERVDILDSKDYNLIGMEASKQHGELFRMILYNLVVNPYNTAGELPP